MDAFNPRWITEPPPSPTRRTTLPVASSSAALGFGHSGGLRFDLMSDMAELAEFVLEIIDTE